MSMMRFSFVIVDSEKYNRIRTALGYFLNANVYRSTFPDDDADAQSLSKSAEHNDNAALNRLSSEDMAECNAAVKRAIAADPAFQKMIKELETRCAIAARAAKGNVKQNGKTGKDNP